MADNARPPVAVRIVRPYPSEEVFLENELETVGKTSIILIGAHSRPTGVILRFEVTLSTGATVLRGEGRVLAHKENAFRGQPGLALRFTRLDPKSKSLVDKAAALREARLGGTPSANVAPADEPSRPDVSEAGRPEPPRSISAARSGRPPPVSNAPPRSGRPPAVSSVPPRRSRPPSLAPDPALADALTSATPAPSDALSPKQGEVAAYDAHSSQASLMPFEPSSSQSSLMPFEPSSSQSLAPAEPRRETASFELPEGTAPFERGRGSVAPVEPRRASALPFEMGQTAPASVRPPNSGAPAEPFPPADSSGAIASAPSSVEIPVELASMPDLPASEVSPATRESATTASGQNVQRPRDRDALLTRLRDRAAGLTAEQRARILDS